jgi:hypothetical protein
VRPGDGGHVQQGAYTLDIVTPQGERVYTRIDSIQTVVPYDADLTEAGYFLDARNQLDPSLADRQGLPAGPHRVLIERVNANHQILDQGVVNFVIPITEVPVARSAAASHADRFRRIRQPMGEHAHTFWRKRAEPSCPAYRQEGRVAEGAQLRSRASRSRRRLTSAAGGAIVVPGGGQGWR